MKDIRKKWLTSYKLNKMRTWLQGRLHASGETRILFVFGCQRSGTTMLKELIGVDSRVNAIGEGDPPYFSQAEDGNYLRLIPNSEIDRLVEAEVSDILLLKPLHDSQIAVKLLARFQDSKGIWIYRDYMDVVQSHLRYYKGRYDPLEYVGEMLNFDQINWKNANLSSETKELLSSLAEHSQAPADLYALFWLARNSLHFSQELEDKVLLLKYEDIVGNPGSAVSAIGHLLGFELSQSAARLPEKRERPDHSFSLDTRVKDACEEMMGQLDRSRTSS